MNAFIVYAYRLRQIVESYSVDQRILNQALKKKKIYKLKYNLTSMKTKEYWEDESKLAAKEWQKTLKKIAKT